MSGWKVLMEYFSDTNVCLVCWQIQSISEQSNIFIQKCTLVLYIEQRTSNSKRRDFFSIACLIQKT